MTAKLHEIRKCIYKRLETDLEFRQRIGRRHGYIGSMTWMTAAELDDFVWSKFKKQRRIIEVVPE